MPRIPSWAKARDTTAVLDDVAPILGKTERDLAAERRKLRTVGNLPLDPAEEQRALRASRPRKRRWAELDRHDRQVDDATQRLEQATAAAQQAEQALIRAPADDARSLTAWLATGETGSRPAASVYERERDRDAARLLVDAATQVLDEALERRLRHVERNRSSMLKDARADADALRDGYVAKVRELAAIREQLLLARDLVTWTATFPDAPESWGFPTALALGLQEPVKRALQTRARLDYGGVVSALEEDAVALAGRCRATTQDQRLATHSTGEARACRWPL